MSTYTPIASQTLSSSAASVTFSSLPQNYTDLIIVVNGTLTSDENNYLSINGINNAGTYSVTRMYGSASARGSNRSTSQNTMQCGEMGTTRSSDIIQILNYTNATLNKTILSKSGNSNGNVKMSVGLSQGTDPVTSITLTAGSTYSSGCTFTVYGVAAGNSSAKATGGNIVTTDGTYWYHTFTTTGTFIPNQALTVDYLVVAGGGGGGSRHAGGGGAGGYRTSIGGSALSLSANTVYQALVGAGGIGATNNSSFTNNGTAGTDSVFSTITSIGGGKGGGNNDVATNGGNGGSGGGGQYGGSGGTGTSGQGNNGGSGSASANAYGGGGGGGSSSGGSNGSGSAGGAGGNGTANSISGTSITYAGGGGGGVYGSGSAGAGGTGGGGAGSTTGNKGTAGTVNLGGGGGGGGADSSPNSGGGNGGSGVIILRYAV